MKHATLTIRLSDKTAAALEKATKAGPYSITRTAVVERGIELALAELERINGANRQQLFIPQFSIAPEANKP